MRFCCNEIESLGCFDSCAETITTALVADAAGAWKIEAEFAGVVISSTVALLDAGLIVFPNKYNEDYTHVIQILRPDGTRFGDKCYSFKTYPTAGAVPSA